ncbi:MAG: ribosome maturation factor RimM [Flavobacteriales bacterium]|nr:ribosome maturation factor RimM [Flavobacteriales bacterium]
MNQIQDCFYIGKIVKKYGFKGEVVLKLDTDVPEAYQEMESLFLDLSGTMVPFFIQKSLFQGQFMRLKFEGVDTEEEADKIIKKEAYLPMDCLPELEDGQFYYHEIEGYKVIDSVKGDIGTLITVNDNAAQPLFEIDYRGTEIYIPVVDDFIEKVDKEQHILYVKTPEGLLDIYMNPQEEEDKDC